MLDISVELFDGTVLGSMVDKSNCLIDIIRDFYNDTNIKVLKYIDPYDDTSFNSFMLQDCLSDISYLKIKVETIQAKTVLDEFEQLCMLALEQIHCHIKVYGD